MELADDINIWKELKSDDRDIFEKSRKHILFCRSLKRDAIFHSVNKLMRDCMQDIDSMDSDEALDHAIDVKSEAIVESARAHGEGLHLRPYMWDWTIQLRKYGKPHQHDPYEYFKFFVRLKYLIDQDETFQKVSEKLKTYMDNRLSFEKAFASDAEPWCMMKENEEGDETDIFKMYVVYYESLKRDKVFSSTEDTLNLVIEDVYVVYYESLKSDKVFSSTEDTLNLVIEDVYVVYYESLKSDKVFSSTEDTLNLVIEDVYVVYYESLKSDKVFSSTEDTLNLVIEDVYVVYYESLKSDKVFSSTEDTLNLVIEDVYVVYYESLKSDKVFSSTEDTLNLVIEDGMTYEDALNFSKTKIRKALGKPAPGLIYK